MTATSIAWSPEAEETVRATRERHENALTGRERLVGAPFGVALLLAAAALAVTLPDPRSFELGPALALLAAFVLAARVEFQTGAGYAVPTQAVFVPMVFLLPPAAVPLLVGAGYVLARALQRPRPPLGPERMVGEFANAWYTLGPVVVIALADAQDPQLGSWPVYVAALAAQFALDAVTAYLRDKAAFGTSLKDLAAELRFVYLLDALLAPVGLMAAIVAYEEPYAFLLALPLVGLISVFRHERDALIDNQLELARAYRGTALLLGEVVEGDDEYTGQHSHGVGLLALDVADEMELDGRARRDIEFAALLHDVGKVVIPKEIVNKPGMLTDEEWAVMRTHTIEGERMLRRVGGVLANVGTIVRASHERWDGGGYPDGLMGAQIPLEARIVSVCDSFSAITTDRPYRAARSVQEAIEELRACAGSQFDPVVVESLVRVVTRLEQATAHEEPARSEQALDRLAIEVDRAAPAAFRRGREAEVEPFRELMDTLEDGIVLHGADGNARDCNRSAERILGIRAADLRGGGRALETLTLLGADGAPLAPEALPWRVALLTRRPTPTRTLGMADPESGETTWLLVTSRPLRRLGRARPHSVVTSMAIADGVDTDRDPVTGIYRRERFEEELERRLELGQRDGDGSALVVVRLHGVPGADDAQLLRTAAAVVKGRLRSSDVVGRLREDEIGVLLPDTTRLQGERVARSLVEVLAGAQIGASVHTSSMEVQAG